MLGIVQFRALSVEETRVLILVVGSRPAKEHRGSMGLLDSPSPSSTATAAAAVAPA